MIDRQRRQAFTGLGSAGVALGLLGVGSLGRAAGPA